MCINNQVLINRMDEKQGEKKKKMQQTKTQKIEGAIYSPCLFIVS